MPSRDMLAFGGYLKTRRWACSSNLLLFGMLSHVWALLELIFETGLYDWTVLGYGHEVDNGLSSALAHEVFVTYGEIFDVTKYTVWTASVHRQLYMICNGFPGFVYPFNELFHTIEEWCEFLVYALTEMDLSTVFKIVVIQLVRERVVPRLQDSDIYFQCVINVVLEDLEVINGENYAARLIVRIYGLALQRGIH